MLGSGGGEVRFEETVGESERVERVLDMRDEYLLYFWLLGFVGEGLWG